MLLRLLFTLRPILAPHPSFKASRYQLLAASIPGRTACSKRVTFSDYYTYVLVVPAILGSNVTIVYGPLFLAYF